MNVAAAACAFPIERSSFPLHTRIYSLLQREFPLFRRNYPCPTLHARGACRPPRPKKRVYACVLAWRRIYRFRMHVACDIYEHIELRLCTPPPSSSPSYSRRFFHPVSAVRIWGKKLHWAWCAQRCTSYAIREEYQKDLKQKFYSPIDFTDIIIGTWHKHWHIIIYDCIYVNRNFIKFFEYFEN